MLNDKIDDKNIGLVKNLYCLRQELDIYCLITLNVDGIKKRGVGKSFFAFLQKSCKDLIALSICRIYEYEKNYELNSIDGVLKHITREQPSFLNSSSFDDFMNKYDSSNKSGSLSTFLSTVVGFKKKYHSELERFKTYRNKMVTHSEYGFDPENLPSYNVMEHLFNFGSDFYKLISRDIVSTPSVSVVPCDLNSDRKVKVGLKRLLQELGLTNIKLEWNE